jgi:hypothetical protein
MDQAVVMAVVRFIIVYGKFKKNQSSQYASSTIKRAPPGAFFF